MKYLKWVAGLVALIFGASIALPANAGTYMSWRMADGPLCFVTGGSTYWPIATSMAAWNKSDVNVIADRSCSNYPRKRQIRMKAYYDSSNSYACGYARATSWSWEYVHYNGTRKASWVPNDMTIFVNFSSRALGCRDTYLDRLHLVSHESGHAFGLDHRSDGKPTVMVSWTYKVPTSYDIAAASAVF